MIKVGPFLALTSMLVIGPISGVPKAQSTMPPLVHLEIAARLKTDQLLPGLFLLTLDCTAGSCSLFRISR
jgi:hypothetical protein